MTESKKTKDPNAPLHPTLPGSFRVIKLLCSLGYLGFHPHKPSNLCSLSVLLRSTTASLTSATTAVGSGRGRSSVVIALLGSHRHLPRRNGRLGRRCAAAERRAPVEGGGVVLVVLLLRLLRRLAVRLVRLRSILASARSWRRSSRARRTASGITARRTEVAASAG